MIRPAIALFSLLMMLVGCTDHCPVEYTGASPDQPIVLPDAKSSWYVANAAGIEFKSKKVQLLDGKLEAFVPEQTEVRDLDLLKGVDPKNVRWQARFSVVNQQALGISLINPEVLIQVKDGPSFTLSDVDFSSVGKMMHAEEVFESRIDSITAMNPVVKSMRDTVLHASGNVSYIEPALMLDKLPELYVYDGPSQPKKAQNQQAIYISGIRKGDLSVYQWLTILDSSDIQVTYHALLMNGDSTLQRTSLELDSRFPYFFVNSWSTHNEFVQFWKAAQPEKPLPSVLLPDAGIVVRKSLANFNWASDVLYTSEGAPTIVIRSGRLRYTFELGQATTATLGHHITLSNN